MDLIPPTHKIKRRNSLHGLIFRRGSDPYSLTPPRSHPVCVCVHIQYYFAYTIMEHSFCALVNYTRKYTFSDILLTLFASTAKVIFRSLSTNVYHVQCAMLVIRTWNLLPAKLDFSSVDLAGLCLPSAEIKSMHHHNMATNLYILLSTPKKFWQHDRCPCLIKLPSNEDEEATR